MSRPTPRKTIHTAKTRPMHRDERAEADGQRPPRVRAEEAVVGVGVLDVGVGVVLGPHADAARGVEDVEPDEEGRAPVRASAVEPTISLVITQ